MSEYSINLESVEQGGKLAELFCLRPKLYKDKQVTLRVKINSKWGWLETPRRSSYRSWS